MFLAINSQNLISDKTLSILYDLDRRTSLKVDLVLLTRVVEIVHPLWPVVLRCSEHSDWAASIRAGL